MTEAASISAPRVFLRDESFDLKKTGSYHLSLLHCGDRLSCAVLNKEENKYIYLDNAADAEALLAGWNSVSLAVAHHKFTLIPSPLFDEANNHSLLGFNHEIKAGEEIFFNTLHNAGARILFTADKNLVFAIREQFPSVNLIHSSTSFMEGVMALHKNSSGKKVFVNFHDCGKTGSNRFFEMVILNSKELLFCNSFKCRTPDEAAYYILFVYEQLNLNPETIELVLSGHIEKTSEEHSLLFMYIRNVKFASRPEGFRYSYQFEEIPNHQFYSLFTQFLVTN